MGILLGRSLDFEHVQTLDLQELNANQEIIDRGTAQTSQSRQTFLFATGVHKVTR